MKTKLINIAEYREALSLYNRSIDYTYYYSDDSIEALSDLCINLPQYNHLEVKSLDSFRIEVDGVLTEFYRVVFKDDSIIYFTEVVTEVNVIEVDVDKAEFERVTSMLGDAVGKIYNTVNNRLEYTLFKVGLKGIPFDRYTYGLRG